MTSTPPDPSAGVLLVSAEDPRSPDVETLLDQHLRSMRSLSPPEDVHALDLDALCRPEVTFLSVRRDGELLAVGALQDLGEGHGELKSMHTRSDVRRTGLAKALLRHLVGTARAHGLQRVSLETGSQPEFAAARGLYAAEGFRECGPFGSYAPSPYSTFMTLVL
jgi:putative acetyltransferase